MIRLLYLSLFLLLACGDDDIVGDAGGSRADNGTRTDAPRPFDAGAPCVEALPVDMLWVIDNSHSMEAEQLNLAANFPVLVDALTHPPDNDHDGQPDVPPITDLRVGVISTDMGVGSQQNVIGCPSSDGDRGELIGSSRAAGACVEVTTGSTPWLQYDGGDATEFSAQFGCIAQLGVTGCGLEQQLEASFAAIGDNMSAGGPNEGFFRDNSLIVVVYVTDEDDCSATDDAIFSATDEATWGPYGLRCANHPEALHPTSRYSDALAALTLDRSRNVIVAAIVGVPADLTEDPANVDINAVLADPRMQFRPDSDNDQRLAPACSFGGVGSATPARRILTMVNDFSSRPGNSIVASICQPDLSPTLRAIADRVAARICDGPT